LRLKALIAGIIFLSLLDLLAPISKTPKCLAEPILFKQREISHPLSDDGDKSSLQNAVGRSLVYLGKNISANNSATRPPIPGNNFFSPERTYRSLALFREIWLSASVEGEFEKRVRECFTFWEANREGKADPTLLTGYYEPILEGNLEPGGEYLYPIYRRPDDLTIPYYSRQEIDDQGALRGKGYELAWLKDPWERFLLHVQGSGRIRLPKGETRRVGFSGSNGRPYRSIGRYLIDRGFLADKPLSLSRVEEFLRQNPGRVAEIFNANERYIFFRFVPGKEGPIGALGFPLTAGRSIATDQAIFPQGGLAFLVAQQPIFDEAGGLKGRRTIRRFVLNQDTGAAMKGPERVDLFCGSGEQAGRTAGEMCAEGKIYFLQTR